jgi:asparagine synthase (glutamine-hydrolysing)
MTDVLRRRGPDDHGTLLAETGDLRLGLGHRRLSILDLSAAGHQPMTAAGLTCVYNGEVYNFMDLRAELEAHGVNFRSHCDTEVILHAFARWDLDCFRRFNGMWAVAIWDPRRRRLVLSRDRLGIKPLYYYWDGKRLVFGSEIKSIVNHPAVESRISPQAIQAYAWLGWVPGPHSAIHNVHKLLPGHCLVLSEGQLDVRPFWSLPSAQEIQAAPFAGRPEEAMEELERLLVDSVRLRLIADVPVGAFLSGGYDSSVIAALMARAGAAPRTFCISFPTANEGPYARKVAENIGCDHTEIAFSDDELREGVMHAGEMFDEPFADPAALPTALLSRVARESVTVILTGDGGDEAFMGYDFYYRTAVAHRMFAVPRWVRSLAAAVASVGNRRMRLWSPLLGARTPTDLYLLQLCMMRPGAVPAMVEQGRMDWAQRIHQAVDAGAGLPWACRANLADLACLLPDCMLAKVDRASMFWSLEARVPLLDYRIVEFAAHLPIYMKRQGQVGKVLLRNFAHSLVPRELLDRPKHGFSVPLAGWFSGPLRDYVNDMLRPLAEGKDEFFRPEAVREILARHGPGCNYGMPIYMMLCYVQWRRQLQDRWAGLAEPARMGIHGTSGELDRH